MPVWALVPLAGVVWWAGGYLFWLLGGLRAVPVGPRLALPLSASTLGALVTGALVGGLAAGLLCLVVARRPLGALATCAGLVLGLVAALVPSAAGLRGEGPDAFAADPLVVTALCAIVVAVSLGGWAIGSAAALGRPGLAVALGVLAGAAPSWLSSALVPFVDTSRSYAGVELVGRVSTWAGAAVLVLALVVAGARPAARLAWWPVVVLLAWFVAPFLTAAGYLEQPLRPGSGLPGTLPDSLAAAWQLFGLAASPAARDLLPWVAALVAGSFLAFLLRDHRQVAAPTGVSPSHSPMINEA
ncbi:hypothetical protein ACI797_16865 [Geodermatophilus sp. SYSU D00691]